jgi:hypothetical protein
MQGQKSISAPALKPYVFLAIKPTALSQEIAIADTADSTRLVTTDSGIRGLNAGRG